MWCVGVWHADAPDLGGWGDGCVPIGLRGLQTAGRAGGRTRGVRRDCPVGSWDGKVLQRWESTCTDLVLGSTPGAHSGLERGEDLLRGPRTPTVTWGFVAHPAGFEPAAIGLEVRRPGGVTCHFVPLRPTPSESGCCPVSHGAVWCRPGPKPRSTNGAQTAGWRRPMAPREVFTAWPLRPDLCQKPRGIREGTFVRCYASPGFDSSSAGMEFWNCVRTSLNRRPSATDQKYHPFVALLRNARPAADGDV